VAIDHFNPLYSYCYLAVLTLLRTEQLTWTASSIHLAFSVCPCQFEYFLHSKFVILLTLKGQRILTLPVLLWLSVCLFVSKMFQEQI